MGDDQSRISRRTVVKGAGAVALIGLTAARNNDTAEQTSRVLNLPAYWKQEHFCDLVSDNRHAGEDDVGTLSVTRDINHVGMSLPDGVGCIQ